MATTVLTNDILEQRTAIYEFDMVKEDDSAFSLAEIEALTLTYYDLDSSEIINSRNFQSVLNVNNVTVDSVGHVTWEITPADSVLVDERKELEQHIALFTWTWASGTRIGSHEIQFPVRKLTLVV